MSIDKVVKVKGYKLMVAMIAAKDKSDGGILLPDQHKMKEDTAAIFGNVIAMGEDAYSDPAKFPNGPRCEIGDWVMFKSFSGAIRFKVKGQEFRLIDDDTVAAVVSDPRIVERV